MKFGDLLKMFKSEKYIYLEIKYPFKGKFI